MINFKINDEKLIFAANEILKEIPNADRLGGEIFAAPIEKGLSVKIEREKATIGYSDVRSFCRALGIYIQHASDVSFEAHEEPCFDTVGMMADVSRNAVLRVESVKKLARLSALEGMNALMLYTEDTYEMKEYPYFGHLRGRYTGAELRELDDYCYALGIELIPCIQTLAHLNAIFEWPDFVPLRDCDDILLTGDEKVFEFIECMFKTMSENLRSRKINLGLDEAKMLGAGRYVERFGYKKRVDIMLDHLKRVTELCKKYGYEGRMWSDMFFRSLNRGVYRVPGTVIPKEVVDSVPPELTLVYWDYREPKKESYDEMFRQHAAFHNPIAFAGGDSSWFGVVPLSRLGLRATRSALASAKEHGAREAYCTMWKDDGGECSHFSCLHVLFAYGEICWTGEASDAQLREKMTVIGASFDDFLAIEDINALPTRSRVGECEANPSKYIFFENVLTGKLSAHIPKGSGEHFAAEAVRVRECAERAGEYRYIYDSFAALCDVLAEKAEISRELYEAYHEENREALAEIALERIERVKTLTEEFRRVFRAQWLHENKNFGFDVMDIRIGGVLCQLETAQYLIGELLAGRIDKIDELEAERLPYSAEGNVKSDGDVILLNRWQRIGAQDISNMFGY